MRDEQDHPGLRGGKTTGLHVAGVAKDSWVALAKIVFIKETVASSCLNILSLRAGFFLEKESEMRHGLNKQGVTLVEVLITVFIMTIGILSCLMYFTTAMRSTELARDVTVATTHGEYLLEEMHSRNTLGEITTANWEAWTDTAGLTTLPEEDITVAFANTETDPLDITVAVNWQRQSRANTINFNTQLTK